MWHNLRASYSNRRLEELRQELNRLLKGSRWYRDEGAKDGNGKLKDLGTDD